MSRLPLLGGIAILALWLLGLSTMQPAGLVDETGHQLAIERIQRGDWDRTSYLVMLPGYHALMALFSMPVGAALWVSRVLTFLMSAVTLVIVDNAARKRHGAGSPAVLMAALLPFYLPFTSMVYTDAGAVLFLAAALLAHVHRYHPLAALAMLAACFMRQSSVVWSLFFIGWIALENRSRPLSSAAADEVSPEHITAGETAAFRAPATPLALLLQMAGHVLVIMAVVTAVALSGALLSQEVPENRPRPNLGNLFLMGWSALLLWLPQWLPLLPGALRHMWRRPLRAATLAGLALAAITFLALSFSNWHPWNQNLDFLRNAPLVWMAAHPLARWLGAAAAVAGLLSAALAWKALSARRLLLWLSACTLLFFLPHALVEARYAIIPFLLADFVADTSRATRWWQAAWYLVLSFLAGALFLSGIFTIW